MTLGQGVALVFAIAAPLGCSEEPAAAPGPAPRQPTAVARPSRSDDRRVAELRSHLDLGRLEKARTLALELGLASSTTSHGGVAGAEAPLLLARLSALTGENLSAIRLLESARKEHPHDPDVYATAAEIYASASKTDAAWDEIKAGEAACGAAPELVRARGIVWLARQGGAKKGLAFLEAARASDRSLPFLDRALGQAHLLLGKEAAAAGDPARALDRARSAASFDPDDVDVRRFLSEALAMNADFEGAVAEIERLVAQGAPLSSELALLHKKAGMAALLERERERALVHFAAARSLGLADDELSTGARLLDEEAGSRVREAVAAYQADDFAAAEAGFRGALALDPDRIEAKNHLAVVLFKKGELAEAVLLWRAVLETARKESLALPEPVHVNLAKAQALSGDPDGARATLEDYLVHDPDGAWADATRAALLALPAKKAGN